MNKLKSSDHSSQYLENSEADQKVKPKKERREKTEKKEEGQKKACLKGLVGKVFNQSIVIGIAYDDKRQRNLVNVQCKCGKTFTVSPYKLKSGHTKSCGCLARSGNSRRITEQGIKKHDLYGIWVGIRSRCLTKTKADYKNYGGRGIGICNEWLNTVNGVHPFLAFVRDMGPRPANYTIDRINNNEGYRPDNCRWLSRKDQNKNKRSTRWVHAPSGSFTMESFCKTFNLSESTVRRNQKIHNTSELHAACITYENKQNEINGI